MWGRCGRVFPLSISHFYLHFCLVTISFVLISGKKCLERKQPDCNYIATGQIAFQLSVVLRPLLKTGLQNMALLTRFIRLPDRANTHVFTFVVTRSVTRDLHRDVTSKEFSYGYHRWAITFSRAGKVLGVYLVWRNPSEVSV